MGHAKKDTDLQNEKTSVNPAANTKKKSTQVQSPNTTDVSAHGNTTDGNASSPTRTGAGCGNAATGGWLAGAEVAGPAAPSAWRRPVARARGAREEDPPAAATDAARVRRVRHAPPMRAGAA